MNAHQFLCSLAHVPMWLNGNKPMVAGSGQRKRWLQDRAVVINGMRPGPDDEIIFPITQLVFFPKSEERRCTMF